MTKSGQSVLDIAYVLDVNIRNVHNYFSENTTVQNLKCCGWSRKTSEHFLKKDENYLNVENGCCNQNHGSTNKILITDFIIVNVCFIFFELFVFAYFFSFALHNTLRPIFYDMLEFSFLSTSFCQFNTKIILLR